MLINLAILPDVTLLLQLFSLFNRNLSNYLFLSNMDGRTKLLIIFNLYLLLNLNFTFLLWWWLGWWLVGLMMVWGWGCVIGVGGVGGVRVRLLEFLYNGLFYVL